VKRHARSATTPSRRRSARCRPGPVRGPRAHARTRRCWKRRAAHRWRPWPPHRWAAALLVEGPRGRAESASAGSCPARQGRSPRTASCACMRWRPPARAARSPRRRATRRPSSRAA